MAIGSGASGENGVWVYSYDSKSKAWQDMEIDVVGTDVNVNSGYGSALGLTKTG